MLSFAPRVEPEYAVHMKLYRFRYSGYARKVQMLLDLIAAPYELVDVPYGDRNELATVTGGYIHVPVLVDGDAVVYDSRVICERLAATERGRRLVPSPLEAGIWAYADFADGPLEDVLFRIASPAARDQWKTPFERALYVLVKERKFGAGCVDAWRRDQSELIARAQHLLGPSLATLARTAFLFGEEPTLADAALYGQCAMLEAADPELLPRVAPALGAFARRLERAAPPVHFSR